MKKYCKKCGLLNTSTEEYGQFKCEGCGFVNKGKTLKKANEKMALFETCKECGFTVRGKLIRKIDEIREYEYRCERCENKWNETWKKTALKDRVKKKIGNLR